MLVDKQNELMSDVLFTVPQLGGDDVTWKPPISEKEATYSRGVKKLIFPAQWILKFCTCEWSPKVRLYNETLQRYFCKHSYLVFGIFLGNLWNLGWFMLRATFWSDRIKCFSFLSYTGREQYTRNKTLKQYSSNNLQTFTYIHGQILWCSACGRGNGNRDSRGSS